MLSNLNSNLALTLGYLNPALNNSAQSSLLGFLKNYHSRLTGSSSGGRKEGDREGTRLPGRKTTCETQQT